MGVRVVSVEGRLWRLIRPDAIYVWREERVRRKLEWYHRVMNDRAPAKFMLAKKVPAETDPRDLATDELWHLHSDLRREFSTMLHSVRSSGLTLDEYHKLDTPKHSFLDVKIEILRRTLSSCELCEWRCRVNRDVKVGVCRLGKESYVTTYFLHVGEEAPLVPSGTIFYGSCNFRCVFCQNYDISQLNPFTGIKAGPKELATIEEYLRLEGARNINHVGGEPTPNVHNIVASFKYLNVNVPQLWNSNMYMTPKTLELLSDLIDIWLPDFKYGNDACALKLSAVRRYYEVITRNLRSICESGDPIIIRHLVLPNHFECCTKPVLEWISENCRNALINIMDQYRPEFWVSLNPKRYPDIARRLRRDEINAVYEYADKLGLDYRVVS